MSASASHLKSDPAVPVRQSTPRVDVKATLPDGRVFEAPLGVQIQHIMAAAFPDERAPIVAASDHGHLRELTTALTEDARLVPVSMRDDDGARIFRRSLIFLMVTAAAEEFPGAEVVVQHSVPGLAGYYCEVRDRRPFSADELGRIERRMREIVDADVPIERRLVAAADAVKLFSARGEADKASLLTHGSIGCVTLYDLRGRLDDVHGYMVPSTACLQPFALVNQSPGFILRFPHQSRPSTIDTIPPYPRLFNVFERANHLLERLGIRNAGALNDAIVSGRLPEVSLVAEAIHEGGVAQIARDIALHTRDPITLVLVAGPSASGKTTFSKRLAVQLLARGLKPFALALDDYFVDRDRTPRDANGQPDFESLDAIDLALFNDHLRALIACQPTELPRYSFLTGRRAGSMCVALPQDSIIIVEGIHGLNPALVREVAAEHVYRVYVSALTQLNLDRHTRISTSDSRLVRRVVRDAATRGRAATDSLRRSLAVARGEEAHIFPYQENSDAIFNSSLIHELAVLRSFAEPLLMQVEADVPEYREARRLLRLLGCFRPAAPAEVPDNSILREFIGGSILEGFSIWRDRPAASHVRR